MHEYQSAPTLPLLCSSLAAWGGHFSYEVPRGGFLSRARCATLAIHVRKATRRMCSLSDSSNGGESSDMEETQNSGHPSAGDEASEDEMTGPVAPNRYAVVLKTEWRTGPRTRAWDELWRWLLSDALPDPRQSGIPRSDGDGEQDTA